VAAAMARAKRAASPPSSHVSESQIAAMRQIKSGAARRRDTK
jgi:hypothetical protein